MIKLKTSKFIGNISWVLFGNIFHAILQFVLNIIAARVFTEYDYGLINYSISIVALFSAVGTLGFNGVITKKISEDPNKAGDFLWSSVLTRILFSIPLLLITLIIGVIKAPNDINLHTILFCQALTILFSSGDLFTYWFRFKYKANLVAILRFVAFLIMAIWRLFALLIFKSAIAYVIGTSLEVACFAFLLIIMYIKLNHPKLHFKLNTVKSMMQMSYPFIFSALLATIYGQTDKIMLESMVDIESVAYYSVSLTLAGAISIIPQAIIEGFRPEIMMHKNQNEDMYKRRFRQLYSLVFWICIAYCIFVTIFAKQVVYLLYGERYLESVKALSLIVWYTSFSYFGAVNNIYMVVENKIKWVQITTLFGAVINILLNLILIPILSIEGAALASLITQFFINFGLLYLIKPLRECFFFQIQGIINYQCFDVRKRNMK